MADSNQLPSMLIESLKEEKEEKKRLENIQKISVSLLDKQNNLSQEQSMQLEALKISLESDSLQTLEDKKEANSVASDTLDLLSDIKDNTEDLKFDFGSGKEGIAQKVIVFGKLLLTSFAAGFMQGLASMFKAPIFVKLFKFAIVKPLKFLFSPVTKLLEYLSRVFSAIGDVYKKAQSKHILKGDTWKVLGKRAVRFLRALFVRVRQVVDLLKFMGSKVKSLSLSIKSVGVTAVSKLLSPFKDVGKAFSDIGAALSKLSSGKGPISSMMRSVKDIGGLLGKFRPLFRALGRLLGKALMPILAGMATVKSIFETFDKTKFTNPIMIGIDVILSAIGAFIGVWVGSTVDLIKDVISWISNKLGFKGFSEFLDSFSIREMIERGFSDIAEFFEALFDPKFLGALMAGVKAAINPADGKSFSEAFDEYAVYGEEGKPETKVIRREGEITPEEIAKYSEETAGMSAPEVISFIKQRRPIDAEIEANARRKSAATLGGFSYMMPMGVSTGAQMEAIQNDTANSKATPVVAPTGIVASMQNIDNSSSSVVKTTNMNNHVDRTSMAAFAPAY